MTDTMNQDLSMRPMSFLRSLWFFGISALIAAFFFRGVIRVLDLFGFRLFVSYLIGYGGPYLIFLLAALKLYRKEGNRWNWATFKERFRLNPMSIGTWGWTIGLSAFLLVSRKALEFSKIWLQENFVQIPKFMTRMFDLDPFYFMEVPVPGNWWILFGCIMLIIVMVIGGELWFRGYILPRQELRFQKSAWIIHALLWNAFYIFWPWELIRFLPGSLALSFAVQKKKNTLIGMIALFLAQIPELSTVVLKILGR